MLCRKTSTEALNLAQTLLRTRTIPIERITELTGLTPAEIRSGLDHITKADETILAGGKFIPREGKARGGKPPLSPEKIERIRTLAQDRSLTVKKICTQEDVDRKTALKHVPELRNSRPNGGARPGAGRKPTVRMVYQQSPSVNSGLASGPTA